MLHWSFKSTFLSHFQSTIWCQRCLDMSQKTFQTYLMSIWDSLLQGEEAVPTCGLRDPDHRCECRWFHWIGTIRMVSKSQSLMIMIRESEDGILERSWTKFWTTNESFCFFYRIGQTPVTRHDFIELWIKLVVELLALSKPEVSASSYGLRTKEKTRKAERGEWLRNERNEEKRRKKDWNDERHSQPG